MCALLEGLCDRNATFPLLNTLNFVRILLLAASEPGQPYTSLPRDEEGTWGLCAPSGSHGHLWSGLKQREHRILSGAAAFTCRRLDGKFFPDSLVRPCSDPVSDVFIWWNHVWLPVGLIGSSCDCCSLWKKWNISSLLLGLSLGYYTTRSCQHTCTYLMGENVDFLFDLPLVSQSYCCQHTQTLGRGIASIQISGTTLA